MVKIGHASSDENRGIRSGKAGDQTGGEVCIRKWYSKPWKALLRPKRPDIAEASAQACEKGCANNHIGYDQYQRNTAHTEAQRVGYNLAQITKDCETDCSAFMTLCAIAAGVKGLEYTGNAPTTSTMVKAFTRTGMYELLTDAKYLLSDNYVKRGDILVTPGKHTVMVLENGPKAEAGKGKSVDEVAREVIAGKWGSGITRKQSLRAAGYDPEEVQRRVNELLK